MQKESKDNQRNEKHKKLPHRQKRFLFFVYDGSGLGHLNRVCRIAESLQGEVACLIVTGHRSAAWLVPKNCEYIHLPNMEGLFLNESQYWNLKPFINFRSIEEVLSFRKKLLFSIFEAYQPDAIFTDYLPLGRYDELNDIIETYPSKKYYIARGVLDDPTTVQKDILSGKRGKALEEYYHRIFVTCDRKVCDLVKEYKFSNILKQKMHYVGYVVEKMQFKDLQRGREERGITDGKKWVVCSVGGGKWGENLIEECINIAQQYHNLYFDIIIGPKSRYECEFLTMNHMDKNNVRIHKESYGLKYLHASADIVISSGGYNSLMESLQGKASIICCPTQFKKTDEQYYHAEKLKKFCNIVCVSDPYLLKEIFHSTLERLDCLINEKKRKSLDFNGISNIKKIVFADFDLVIDENIERIL
jgi:predicted glycosyltransferase